MPTGLDDVVNKLEEVRLEIASMRAEFSIWLEELVTCAADAFLYRYGEDATIVERHQHNQEWP